MATIIKVTRGKELFPRCWDHGMIPYPEPTYSIVSGTLPAGLVFSSGLLSGTTNAPIGSSGLTIRTTNTAGSRDFNLTLQIVEPILIADNTTIYPIYYWNEVSGTKAQKAAGILATALNAIASGCDPFVAQTGSSLVAPPTSGFLIGEIPFTGFELPNGNDFYLGQPNPNRKYIGMVSGLYVIRGGTGSAICNAVTWFLEEYFDVLFAANILVSGDNEIENPSVNGIEIVYPTSVYPLSAPQLENRISSRYVFAGQMAGECWNTDYIDYIGALFTHSSSDGRFIDDTLGHGVHAPSQQMAATAAYGHPTQGAYAKEQSGVIVLNHLVSGIFQVDETVNITRGGSLIKTAKVTWPAKDNSYYLFLYNPSNADALQTFDMVSGLTSSATCLMSGTWQTAIYPMVFPVSGENDDAYDPTKRRRYESTSLPGHLCYSDPNLPLVLSILYRHAWSGMTDEQIKQRTAFLGTKDWWGDGCYCTRCVTQMNQVNYTQVDGQVVSSSRTEPLIRMLNTWIADMRSYAGFENSRCGSFAYFHTYPPTSTVMASGTHIFIPHLRYCIHHPSIGIACNSNRGFDNNLRQWLSIASTSGADVLLWDYLYNFVSLTHPFPAEGELETVRRARELKTRVYYTQGANSTGGALVVPKSWILCHILWHPQYPIRFWANRFFDKYIPLASTQCKEFWNLIESAVYNSAGYPDKHADEFQTLSTSYTTWLTPTIRESARTLWNSALLSTAGNTEQTRRIQETFGMIIAAWDGCFLDNSVYANVGTWQLVNHPTQSGVGVIERNLGDGRGYRNTYDIALSGILNDRGTASSEYTDGVGTRLSHYAANGGPVLIFEDGSLRVEAYTVNSQLRIRRVAFSGINIIPAINNTDGYSQHAPAFGPGVRGFPEAGGYYADSWQYSYGDAGGNLVSRSGLVARLKSYTGVSAWNGAVPDGFSFADITVNGQAADPYIEIVYSLQKNTGGDSAVQPVCGAYFASGCTITPTSGSNRYDVTNLPGLTNVTVRDQFSNILYPLESINISNPDPNATAGLARVITIFGAGSITTTETPWVTRRLSIIRS